MTDRRPITAAVRRRAWGELGVRPWTFLTVMLLLAALVLAGTRWGDWKHERDVIEHGTQVTAEVVYVGLSLAREGNRDEVLSVALHYTPPGSNTQLEAWNDLPRKPGQMISAKDKLQVRIDPNKPDFWTERTEPAPLALVMVAPLLCASVAFGCFLIALVKQRGAVSAYRSAEPSTATVIAVRQSPLAPLSKLLSVSIDGSEDRRVRDCYWPTRAGAIHPQASIEVYVSKNRTFAAAAYGLPAEIIPSSGT